MVKILRNKRKNRESNASTTEENQHLPSLRNDMNNKVKVTEIVYELQHRKTVITSHYSSSEFVNARGEPTSKQQIDEKYSNTEWKWLTDGWLHGGSDSWQYSSKWHSKDSSWSYAEGIFDSIRRRKWTHTRVNSISADEYKSKLNHRVCDCSVI
jgi:hypothetical protein